MESEKEKIILAVADKKQSTVLYVTDDGTVYDTEEMLLRARNGRVAGVHVVNRNGILYLRVDRKKMFVGIDTITLKARQLIFDVHDVHKLQREKVLRLYWNMYQKKLASQQEVGEVLVAIDDSTPYATKGYVKAKLVPLTPFILKSARKAKIDPYFLAAILVDEVVRLAPFEGLRDAVLGQYMSMNVSVGYGQIMLNTARGLIRDGRVIPSLPGIGTLDQTNIHDTRNAQLYPFVAEVATNIDFAAARIAELRDVWKGDAGIDLDEVIIATLYSLEYRKPHVHPEANDRGLQIVDEFMPLAKQIMHP